MPPHPAGATDLDILNEPDWTQTHSHRVGLRNRDQRFPGLTHESDDWRYELEKEAEQHAAELRAKAQRGELLTVRDFLEKQEDFHLRRPDVHPEHWRYVLHTTEEYIKDEQPWLINEQKREQDARRRSEDGAQQQDGSGGSAKKNGETGREGGPDQGGTGQDGADVQAAYSPEQQALLQDLKREAEDMRTLLSNDGKGRSPVDCSFIPAEIDETDQYTPDNWVPRTDHLVRLTGKHPLNGEPPLAELLDAGLTTPNWLHFVRNHGPVPHLLWENHKLEISAGRSLTLLMDDLKDQFESVNIPAVLACDGNRRKELNLIKRSKGFNWGPGAVGCAYWKGVPVRDVLLKADILQLMDEYRDVRLWVNFGGSEELSEGMYETSIPLDYCMDPCNDVILAYEMNDSPLPPDHGYPLRLLIPGYVGGRSVKWLENIWVTDRENDSYYHIFDNRVVPPFVVDRFDEMGQTMYRHPSTACMEQMLNSVIARPAQGERIDLAEMIKGRKYRITGYAYNGGGNEVQRVEVSLDGGLNWLYCIRKYPETPLRHGKKFWTWLHWHVDIDITQLLRAENIMVRCWDVNKNTQPEKPTWNLEGMMNNCQYTVKSEISVDEETKKSYLLFRHPAEPGAGENGWMKPSISIQKEDIRRSAAVPEKQFTREEIEKHASDHDCWIVVNDKVYNATSVLSWHPGGKGVIMAHAGRVHQETTDEFESIHDDYAVQKLGECLLGSVTKKAQEFMKKEAEEMAKEKAESAARKDEIALKRHKYAVPFSWRTYLRSIDFRRRRWSQVKFLHKRPLSEDTKCYTFALPSKDKKLGLETGQHLQIGFHFKDRLVIRPYTPVRPILATEEDGTFDLVVKTYFPSAVGPGGTMSNILDCLQKGEEIEVKGPTGEIRYRGNGQFLIDDKTCQFQKITLILGGSGITPGYQLIARILKSEPGNGVKIRAIDANKTENDILMHGELDKFALDHPDQFEITHVLSHPGDSWKGQKGHVNEEIIHRYAFEPGDKNVALLCGPPAMIKTAVLPVLKKWGYDEDKNLFGF
ncbi:putative nitrate reductase [Aspergillus clavatus NRRL 1]|uniref:Nitrate reductase [NADPH] n=1 Tax=Aspergillus clavatus (strain ATCC 1007 / CBS 513.65 / DSM 816 / NCTC 3887 / NRRL 1 / QM 1276 / 107) TaxID=344612 RepID=A1CAZ4_ASPCL|nr:nitrate reductase, putative [Aspergillus clavatus NRRL 1]EAW12912.1 nitrate reductase, putative [Aspergillus clavatus NRRL 1]